MGNNTFITSHQSYDFLSVLKLLAAFILPFYFIVVSLHGRYIADDYIFLEQLDDSGGPIEAAKYFYFNYEGAFLMFLREFSYFHFFSVPVFLIVTALLHIISAWFFISSVFHALKINLSRVDIMLFGSLLVSGIYFLSTDVQGTYHWLAGTVYIYVLTISFWAWSFFLRKKPWIALFFFVLLMQTKINFSSLTIAGVGLIFLYYWVIKKEFKRDMLYALIVMLIFWLIFVLAPGNYKRSATSEFGSISFLESLNTIFLTGYLRHSFHLLAFALISALLLPHEILDKIKLKGKVFFLPIVLVLVFVAINMACMKVATKLYYYAYRVWVLNAALYAIVFFYYVIVIVLMIKKRLALKFATFKIIPVTLSLFLVAYMVFIFNLLSVNLPLMSKFDVAYDEMIHKMKTLEVPNGDTLWIPIMPDSGVLRTQYIVTGEDKSPYFETANINKQFWKHYDLKYRVYMTYDTALINAQHYPVKK
jgi:hypothetical protein